MGDAYHHLLGAADVKNAAHQMQGAADDMSRAASSISESADRQQRFMDEWLTRLEAVLAEARQP